ncbi:MAG: Gfo/Idh/MocA family protein [Beutenbergiaceae bacterium]
MTTGAAFLGGGFMASVHVRAARMAGARLIALASSNPDSAQRAATELGVESAATSVEQILSRPDVDVVHVCSPNAMHAEQAVAALAAGKNVICEKPLATTVTEARAVRDAARTHGQRGAIPFVYRYHPVVQQMRKRIADGKAGPIMTLDGSYLQDWLLSPGDTNWRANSAMGGSSRAFADIGSHLCDLIEFITGDRIASLTARTRIVYSHRQGDEVENEDVAALVVELAGGGVGSLLISQVAPGRKNGLTLEIHGSQESYRFSQEQPEELWIGRQSGSQLLLRSPDAPGDRGLSILPAGHPLGYQDAFNAFVADAYAAIDDEPTSRLPSFEDGLRAAHLTAAVLESARTGSWVSPT